MKNIDCVTAERWIVQDLDEGLDKEKKTLLQNHVSGCEKCAKLYDDIPVLLSRFSSDVPEDPSEEFWARYHSSLDARLREKEPRESWVMWWKPAAAFGMVIAVLVAFLVVEFRPERVDQSLGQAILSPALIAELDALYGPVSEEDHDPLVSSGLGGILTGSGTLITEDLPFQWFEVEDEPNYIFL
jgi:hypothetical protein